MPMPPVVNPLTLTLKGFLDQSEIKAQEKHSRLRLQFGDQANGIAKGPQIAMALPDLLCSFGGRAIVPDEVVFCWER